MQWHIFFVLVSSLVLVIGFIFEVKPMFESPRPKPAGLPARWGLWLGAVGLLAVVLTGFLLPPKSVFFHEAAGPISEHRFLGLWTAAVFLAISVGRWIAGPRSNALLVLVWMSALWVLGMQIYSGIQLGVNSLF